MSNATFATSAMTRSREIRRVPSHSESEGRPVHIPDGYISPETAVAMYGVAAPFWYTASRKLKRLMSGQTVPLLALFSAFSFTIMMFNVPIPGGTTAHAVGGTLAAIVMGPGPRSSRSRWRSIIQALFFGDGGITAIGANCFNMAIVLPLVGYGVYWLLSRDSDPLSRRRLVGAAIGAYLGINLAGPAGRCRAWHSTVFWSHAGRALYAPYPLSVSRSRP